VKKQLPAWLVLLIITLVAGLALGGTYALTKDAIDTQAIAAAENARKAALPAADTFTEMDLSVKSASAKGFAGPVHVELSLDAEGKIAALKIGNEEFAETPGFGAAALEESFAAQFIGKAAPLALSDIDAISGATVTTNAVVEAVNAAAQIPAPAVDWCYIGEKDGQAVGYVAQITVQGFGGPIEVIAGVDLEMNITGISVGGSNFSETAGLGAKAKDPSFAAQFVGKPAPVKVIKAGGTPADNTVDAITAATITSNAVANAVNKIADLVEGILFPNGRGDEVTLPEKPADESTVFGASQKGFKSPVYAEAAFDAEGKIIYISIGNEEFAETDGIGTQVLEAEFMAQFIGKQMPLSLSDIDAASGATVTSKAVVDALNAAYSASQGAEVAADPTMPPMPADETIYGASSKGFAGPVWVDVAFDAEGKITYLSVGNEKFAETDGFGSRAKEESFMIQFIGKAAPLNNSDVDLLTGATITSEAVVKAINKAYEKATGASGSEATPAPTAAPAAGKEGAFSASSKGYNGPVWVEVSFDGNKITSLVIGDDRFAETAGLGSKVKEEAFIDQFIGKTAPLALSDIDAVTGATVTSEAVVSAINKAYEKSTSEN